MDIKKVLQDYISYHWIEDYITDEQKDAMLKNLGVYIEGMQPQLLIHSVVVNEAEKVGKKPNKNIKPISKRPVDDCADGSEVPFCQCKQPKMLGVEEIDRNRCKICKNPFW